MFNLQVKLSPHTHSKCQPCRCNWRSESQIVTFMSSSPSPGITIFLIFVTRIQLIFFFFLVVILEAEYHHLPHLEICSLYESDFVCGRQETCLNHTEKLDLMTHYMLFLHRSMGSSFILFYSHFLYYLCSAALQDSSERQYRSNQRLR